MALIRRIAGYTRVLGRAQGFTPLPVLDELIRVEGRSGTVPAMRTAWELTPEERSALDAGASLYLRLWGTQWPPAQLYVGAPCDDEPLQPPQE